MTHKERLIKRLNDLRTRYDLPPYDPQKLKMSCEEIEGLIYHLETPSHSTKIAAMEKTPSQIRAEGLARLNVLRKRAKEKPLLKWTRTLDDLQKAIKDMQLEIAQEALIKSKRGTTKIADGADTRRTHTDLHNNPIVEDMKKMRAREERRRLRGAKEKARAMSLWTGYKTGEILAYLLAQANTDALPLAGDALKADIQRWLAMREKALPQRRGRQPSALRLLADDLASRSGEAPERLLKWLKKADIGDLKALPKAWLKQFRAFLKSAPAPRRATGKRASGSVTPQSIADETSLSAKQVRVLLRKLEPKIKAVWRVADERWGFKPEHKADIVKLIKGGV